MSKNHDASGLALFSFEWIFRNQRLVHPYVIKYLNRISTSKFHAVLGDCCIEGKFTCEDCNDLDNPWILGRTFKVYNYDCKGEKPIYDTALDPTNNEMILNWSGEKWTAYSWYGGNIHHHFNLYVCMSFSSFLVLV